MWHYVWDSARYGYRFAMRWLLQLDSQEWTYVFIAVVLFGVICLSGFKSRLRA